MVTDEKVQGLTDKVVEQVSIDLETKIRKNRLSLPSDNESKIKTTADIYKTYIQEHLKKILYSKALDNILLLVKDSKKVSLTKIKQAIYNYSLVLTEQQQISEIDSLSAIIAEILYHDLANITEEALESYLKTITNFQTRINRLLVENTEIGNLAAGYIE